ncbi:MAG: polyisoprenoid-binding protein [Actinobacteria bacterium ATB1]|nr:polyisoprenoid-binding protein [Actinobacteria bacterium ATB1]
MTATQTVTRTVQGVDVPQPGSYELDPSHTHVGFAVRHMMVSKVRGKFSDVLDTRDEQRDEHLRSPDFFDVDSHPDMTFHSTSVTRLSDDRYRVDGDLTIRGVTKQVSLDTSFEGGLLDPYGNQRIGFSATGEINREDFGLTWNQALETGGVVVGKKVQIEIEAEATRPA